MTYDPAWDMPFQNWQQQGSFQTPEVPPDVDPDAGTQVCVGPFAAEWLPYIQGAMDQLRNPSSWAVADDAAMYATLSRVTRLKEIFGSYGACMTCPEIRLQDCVLQSSCDGGATWTDVAGWVDNFPDCVSSNAPPRTPPPNPGDRTPDQMSCSIASFLTDLVIQPSIQKTIDDIILNRNLLQLAIDISDTIPEFFWTNVFINAVNIIYQAISAGTISDFESAMTDHLLWDDVRCAIYTALGADGKITEANFATILTNIAAISYTHPAVVTAVHDYVQAYGWAGLAAASQGAGLNPNSDCSDCGGGGTWCYKWDYLLAPGGLVNYGTYAATWVGGQGWETAPTGGGPPAYSLRLKLEFGSPIFIHQLEVNYFCGSSADTGGMIHLINGSTTVYTHSPPAGAGAHVFTDTVDVTATRIELGIDSDSVSKLTELVFNGNGENPFGENNC